MITKDELKMFRKDFDTTIAELGKKYNIKIELGSISYSNDEFHGKMTCTKLSETGETGEKKIDVSAFGWLKELFGFKGNIGDTYTDHRGVTYTVCNLDPKKSKYPVLVKGSDGKNYKASVAMVNMHLTAQKLREAG